MACWARAPLHFAVFSVIRTIVPLWLALVSPFRGRDQGPKRERHVFEVSAGVGTQACEAPKLGVPRPLLQQDPTGVWLGVPGPAPSHLCQTQGPQAYLR